MLQTAVEPTTLALVDTVVNILTLGGIVAIAFAAGGAKKAIAVLERDVDRLGESMKSEVHQLELKVDSIRAAIGTRSEDRAT